MTEKILQAHPMTYSSIDQATRELGFTMASDVHTGSLLRVLAASKRGGNLLELGTGTGLSTAWILDGMDASSRLTTVDNDPAVLRVAHQFLGSDKRVRIVQSDGGTWIEQNDHLKFDFIFADTWHGKYLMLEEILTMLTTGGLYVVDDMLPQANWPEGHHEKVLNLVERLERTPNLLVTKLHWSTGIMICTKTE